MTLERSTSGGLRPSILDKRIVRADANFKVDPKVRLGISSNGVKQRLLSVTRGGDFTKLVPGTKPAPGARPAPGASPYSAPRSIGGAPAPRR